MEKITKAEQLKIKQATESLTRQLSIELVDFRERFLTSYVNYCFSKFDTEIKKIKAKVFNQATDGRYGAKLEDFTRANNNAIARMERQKMLKSTNTLTFITEANDNYTTKFIRLVNELVKHGVRSYPLTIEQISSGSTANDFNFLITHKTTVKTVQVYARIIFAEGEINAPHYRFIITANKNLIH